MSKNMKIRFFLGSNTKRGFVSLFDQLRDYQSGNHLYIIKGGPGSGKSSLMRRISKTLEAKGHNIEYIYCSSDPNSLDAIIDHDAKISMVDGTAPHTLDPGYPGAYDSIINMGELWNKNKLMEQREDIIHLNDMIHTCHSMATSCISSAAALLDSNQHIASGYLNTDAIEKELSNAYTLLENSPKGKERLRLLSAVSVGEFAFFEDTIKQLCPKVHVISDEWGASSGEFLKQLREYALNNSLEVITCYCSIHTRDKIDHLLFPKAGIAYATSNAFHTIDRTDSILIEDLMNPIDLNMISSMTSHLTKAIELIELSCHHVKRAKLLHDDLEQFYVSAMDFSQMDRIYEKLIDEINELSLPKNKFRELLKS